MKWVIIPRNLTMRAIKGQSDIFSKMILLFLKWINTRLCSFADSSDSVQREGTGDIRKQKNMSKWIFYRDEILKWTNHTGIQCTRGGIDHWEEPLSEISVRKCKCRGTYTCKFVNLVEAKWGNTCQIVLGREVMSWE